MFGWVKERFSKKDDDYEHFKSHILGREMRPEPIGSQIGGLGHGFDEHAPRQPGFRMQTPERTDLVPMFDRESDDKPPSLGRLAVSQNDYNEEAPEKSHRIEDSLLVIKEQLNSIRSQNEVINERLKKIEGMLGAENF